MQQQPSMQQQPIRRSARLAAKTNVSNKPVSNKPDNLSVCITNLIQSTIKPGNILKTAVSDNPIEIEVSIHYRTGPKTDTFAAAQLQQNMYRIIMKNGTIYEGEIVDTWFHGKGKFIYPITDVLEVRNPTYVGEFKNGMENGKGKYDFGGRLDNYYEGDFVDGKWHGEGIRVINGKLYHNGRYENDSPCF